MEWTDSMAHQEATLRTTRGIQQPLLLPLMPERAAAPSEIKGVVYTKQWVVNAVLDLAGYRSDQNLVDKLAIEPAAGEGAFLGPMVERLIDSCRCLGKPISSCRDSLIAYEFDDESAFRARQLAVATLIAHQVEPSSADELADSWVRVGDYLLEAVTESADFIIGNPPYVRLEDIPQQTASLYRESYRTMRGRADLYIAFFEAALLQLRQCGVCAFICADRWMRNQYGAELRELVTSGYAVEAIIEMHAADPFEDEVDAYPAITVIRRQSQGPTLIASAGPELETAPPQAISNALQAAMYGERTVSLPGLRTATLRSWFKCSVPWPCHSPNQLALLRSLEDPFVSDKRNERIHRYRFAGGE